MHMQSETFVFFGIVGSGKGTQAKLLMDYVKNNDSKDIVNIATGDEFRKLIQNPGYVNDLVRDILNKGGLQPDFLTIGIFSNILVAGLDNPDKHLFFDGFPRSIPQAEAFVSAMNFYKREKVNIFYIKVGKEEATKRMKLRGRSDDVDEGIAKRFEEYENNVLPAMEYLKSKTNCNFFEINGEQEIEPIQNDIIKALGFEK